MYRFAQGSAPELPLRVLMVDHSQAGFERFRAVVEGQPSIELVASAIGPDEGLHRLVQFLPDVLVLRWHRSLAPLLSQLRGLLGAGFLSRVLIMVDEDESSELLAYRDALCCALVRSEDVAAALVRELWSAAARNQP